MISWAYIAGFFDGEGHVSLGRQKNCGEGQFSRGSPRVTIVQSRERGRVLLESIAGILAGHSIRSAVDVHREAGDRNSVTYRLRITGFNSVIRFLRLVFPYLHIKKIEAQDIIRYDKVFPTLIGRGHSHSDNTRKAWVTRRERYGYCGRKMDTRS